MGRCAVPVRASVRDLLRDLLGRPITVRDAEPLQLSDQRRAMMASYRYDDRAVAAATFCDVGLAAKAGAAIAMMPAPDAEGGDGGLDEELGEFFHEVVNVFAKLLNSPTTPHVSLHEIHPVPGEVPGDAARMALEPATRVDYRVEIEGYGSGTLVLVTG